jgi:hypothetical protein
VEAAVAKITVVRVKKMRRERRVHSASRSALISGLSRFSKHAQHVKSHIRALGIDSEVKEEPNGLGNENNTEEAAPPRLTQQRSPLTRRDGSRFRERVPCAKISASYEDDARGGRVE